MPGPFDVNAGARPVGSSAGMKPRTVPPVGARGQEGVDLVGGRTAALTAFQTAVRAALAEAVERTWVEDEGENLGSLALPPELITALRTAPCVEVHVPRTERVRRLVATYGAGPPEAWIAALDAIATRLGPHPTRRARAAGRAGDTAGAVDVLLGYYGRGYAHRLALVERPALSTRRVGRRG